MLRGGDLRIVDEINPDVLSFVRTAGGAIVLVTLNCSDSPQIVSYDAAKIGSGGQSLTTLVQSFDSSSPAESLDKLALPAFGVFAGEIR